jgi:ribonuclease-3
VGTEFGLEKFVLMSRGEAKDIGKAREVILANTVEALIGAIYLDQGLAKTENFVKKFILSRLDEVLETKSYKDSKSELQEIIQEKLKVTPTYKVLEEEGPAHRRTFRIGVYFGEKLVAEGSGASKQEGELEAAKGALKISKSK